MPRSCLNRSWVRQHRSRRDTALSKPSLCTTRPPTRLTTKPSNEGLDFAFAAHRRTDSAARRAPHHRNNELGQGRSRATDVTVTQVRRILCGKLVLTLQAGQPVLGIG